MPNSAAGWVNLNQYLGLNADAGQQMAQQGAQQVKNTKGQANIYRRAVTGEAKRSGMQGGTTDLSKQGSYADYANALAGLQSQAAVTGPSNPWDAAVAAPYWTANKDAQGAWERFGQMGNQQAQVTGSVAANQARAAQRAANFAASTARRDSRKGQAPASSYASGPPQYNVDTATRAGSGGSATGTVDQRGDIGNPGGNPWVAFLDWLGGH